MSPNPYLPDHLAELLEPEDDDADEVFARLDADRRVDVDDAEERDR